MKRFHTGSTTSTVRPCWNQPAKTTSSSRESPRIWLRQVAGYHFAPGVDVAGDVGERLQHPGQVEVPLI